MGPWPAVRRACAASTAAAAVAAPGGATTPAAAAAVAAAAAAVAPAACAARLDAAPTTRSARPLARQPVRPLGRLPGRPPAAAFRCEAMWGATAALGSRGAYTGSAAEALPGGMPGGAKKLSDIAKVQLLMKESPVRVREIWLEQFREKELAVAGTLAKEEYHIIHANATACPMFLAPVPRGQGYLNLVWQFQGNSFLYQTLESFQQGGSGQVDFGWVVFTDLLGSHNLALLHGELQSGLLTKVEAARLVRFTREAYMDPAAYEWVQRFNLKAREFDYEEFMQKFRPLDRLSAIGASE